MGVAALAPMPLTASLINNRSIERVTLSIRVLNDHLSCTDGIGWSGHLKRVRVDE